MKNVSLLTKLKTPTARPFTRSEPFDAGMDMYADENFTLKPGERKLVSTGVMIAIPVGQVGLVHPRSGLAKKHGITVLNAPGTIDCGYRGVVMVNLYNASQETYEGSVGDRIAQLIIQDVALPKADVVDKLPPSETERGEKGHGSTGK